LRIHGGGDMQLKRYLGCCLLSLSLVAGCATTGNLASLKKEIKDLKEENEVLKIRTEELKNLDSEIYFNLLRFMDIYNQHLLNLHSQKRNILN
jgi:hypothetical protein